MKARDFLRDKAYLIVLGIFAMMTLYFFMTVLNVQNEVVIVVLLFIGSLIVCVLGVEWGRRHSYYQEMRLNLEALDKKYLITEMDLNPRFIDGQIMADFSKETHKSMADEVAHYKLQQTDYRDYIELWIHEVKTPLSAIHLMAANHPSEIMTAVKEELLSVDNYVEQALFYARSNAVEKDFVIHAIDLDDSVRNVVRDLASVFIQKQVSVSVVASQYAVYSDAKWLEFILKQVIGNALKYVAPVEGAITIEAHEQIQSIMLTIKDNGPGISAADLKRVFDKGFTGQHGRHQKQATGMGLYLVKRLGDALHMSVDIQSHAGTTVTLSFPKSDMMFH